MFNKKIREAPLITGIANEFFQIHGGAYNNDMSFLATLRALLHKRSHGAAVDLVIRSFNSYWFSRVTLNVTNAPTYFSKMSSTAASPNGIEIINLTGLSTDNATTFALLDNPAFGYTKSFPKFHEAKDLRAFVQNRGKFNVRFYINEQDKKTLIVCENLSLPGFHLLQSLTPRLFPWFFTENPLDELESSLLDALTYRTATEYERILSQLAERIDFREQMIKNMIGEFELSGRREEAAATRRRIDDLRREIQSMNQRYSDYMRRLDEMGIILAAQEMAIEAASDGSELLEYFICNRNVMPVQAHSRTLDFTVKTFFENFDPEQYNTYIHKNNSFLYNGYEYSPQFSDMEVRRKILNAVFSDEPLLKIKMCSNYRLDLRGTVSAQSYYDYGKDFEGYIPNPHIQHYACIGSYRPYINKLIQEGSIVGAIEQCIASAKSLNFAEPHTVRFFLTDLFTSNKRIVRLKDGRDVTLIEALEYLNTLDAKKEEENV